MFNNKAVVTLLTVFVLSTTSLFDKAECACSAEYGQCGGIGWTGPTCCVVSYECKYGNDYYSQCLPSTTKDPACSNNALWGQCAGIVYSGPTCCPVGSTCVYKDDYYSQCRPISEASSTRAATSTKPTTKASTSTKSAATSKSTTTKKATTSTAKATTTKSSSSTKTTKATTIKTTKSATTSKSTTTTNKITTNKASSSTKTTRATTTTLKTTTTPSTSSTTTTTQATSGTPTYSGVLATRHEAYEIGACMLPETAYTVNRPFAMGDISAISTYKYRPAICGHIFRINCGVTTLDIIATNSNLGGGLDLYKETWNEATGNKPPGQTYCTLQLTDREIFTTSGFKCYYGGGWSDWYHKVALFNTKARLVSGATMNGQTGQISGGAFYAFNFYAPSATSNVTFMFEDGGSYTVKLSDCLDGTNMHYWS